MRIITSGGKFLDIDGYSGCIAFAELLQKQGIEARRESATRARIPTQLVAIIK